MDYLQQLVERYPSLAGMKENILRSFNLIAECFAGGGKLLIAGNGGSAADADHIAAELMKSFVKKRPPSGGFKKKLLSLAAEGEQDYAAYLAGHLQGALPAIALSNHAALNTAFINDVAGDLTFAQQVYGYGAQGDVLLAISTSGNSKNILYAMLTAKAAGLKIVLLTGSGGGKCLRYADEFIAVPESETYKVQELHLPVYHTLCLMLEERFFNE